VSAPRRPTSARRPRGPAAAGAGGRERILQAAIRAFSEVGYAGTTTAGIARAAGVTQPLVHHHFGSKDGLWRAAMEVVFAPMPRVPTRGLDGLAARETLLSLVEQFVRFVAAHPEVTRIIAREGAAAGPRLDHLVERYLHEPFRGVVALLRAAQGADVVARDVRPELCLFLILGAGSHLFDVTALAARSQGIDTTAPSTRDAFVAMMRTMLEHGLLRRGT
jgi:TetR/AcrR family transcriptional regulator